MRAKLTIRVRKCIVNPEWLREKLTKHERRKIETLRAELAQRTRELEATRAENVQRNQEIGERFLELGQ